jgi:PAS domain S-box-containing protein
MMICVFAPDHRVHCANRRFREQFGEPQGRRCFEYTAHRTDPCPECQTFTPLETGKPQDWAWYAPDGSWYRVHDFPFADSDGSPLILAMQIDETEHLKAEAEHRRQKKHLEKLVKGRTTALEKKNIELAAEIAERKRREEERTAAEQALRESEERLNRAQEIAHLGSWELDVVNDRLSWSDEVYRIFGLRPQEFGATFEAFLEAVHPEDRLAVDAAYSGSLREGRDSYEIEHRVVRRSSGEVRVVLEKCQHVRDAAGRIIRSVGMVHDISDRKRVEEALRRSEQRLRAVNDRLVEADRRKDEFLGILSHELRTPLNAIMGWSSMLAEGRLAPATQPHAVEVISRNAKAQLELLDDILDVSRVISGKMTIASQQVDIVPVMNQAIESVRPAAVAKGIVVAVDAPPGLLVSGDANRLQQTFWNLLSNAVKFTPTGGQVMVLMDREGSYVRVRISDTGIGIAPVFLPRIFDRFVQVDSSAARHHGGLGLGLAIVRHLVELHGGTVQAESTGVGRGATFTIRFPQRAVSTEPGATAETTPLALQMPRLRPGEPGPAGGLERVRVLAVDDEADARELVQMILEQQGAKVATASSTEEALARLEVEEFDVLVADIGMPGEDGYALARRLRAQGAAVPAIALTAYGRETDRASALDAGFCQHLVKPVPAAELVQAVRRALSLLPGG